jgi:hypothetical protein
MKAVLDDIVAQLNLCATLMSDADLLREQAHVVAAQFRVAASRIEQLKAYLKKPSKGVSPEKPWFDDTILDGIDALVDVTLRRHMLPLGKGFEFPKIFEKELKIDSLAKAGAPGHGENLLKREIKETNCMGAMILLYYFLYWHAVLILFNHDAHPMCYMEHLQEDEDELSALVKKALEKLPRGNRLLEHRGLGQLLASSNDVQTELKNRSDKEGSGLYSTNEINSDMGINSRVSFAVHVWRRVLKDDFTFGNSDNHRNIAADINGLLGFCIGNRINLFGGVISTFELQDDIDKWNDMDRILQVQSTTEHQSANTYTQYAYRLADVLKNAPYSLNLKAFQDKARVTAVHDYGSVPLMVDITKSFIGLARVIKYIHTKNDCMISIAQMISAQCEQFDETTKTKLHATKSRKDRTKFHSEKFIQFTPNWRRNVCEVSNIFTTNGAMCVNARCVVDDLGGYYWGAQPCDLIQHNHQYLAFPSVETDLQQNESMTGAFQALYPDDDSMNVLQFALTHLISIHRNSLFVSLTCQSLLKFTDTLSLLWRTNTVVIPTERILRPLPKLAGTNGRRLNGTKVSFGLSDAELGSIGDGDRDQTINTSISSLRKLLQLELTVLHNRVEQARTAQFRKYPGISWPVKYKTNSSGNVVEHDNFTQFDPIHEIPRTTPSVAESADSVARAFEGMSNSALFGPAFERFLNRPGRPTVMAVPPPQRQPATGSDTAAAAESSQPGAAAGSGAPTATGIGES